MPATTQLKVADEMWIAAALLQRELGLDADFTPADIVRRAVQEHLSPERRPGVLLHAQYHAVASRPPNPGRYRMLTETRRGRRRLFRPGDPSDPRREGAKAQPHRNDIPQGYHYLVDWYVDEYLTAQPEAEGTETQPEQPQHPMDALREWAWRVRPFRGIDADKYVAELREGWDE